MKKIYFLAIILLASVASFAQASFTQSALTPGNLVVFRAGDGSAALTAAGTAIFLDEYTPAGALVQSIAVPTTTVGSNRRVVCAGSTTSEGYLTRSDDGQYIVFAGYDAAVGLASVGGTTSAANPRVIGRLDNSGTLNTTTALTDAISGGNARGATSTNGTDLWISGTAGTGGIRYATLGGTTSISLTTTPTNLRATAIYGGQLYVSSQSGAFRLATVGTGTPTTAGQTTTNLPGFPTATGSPYQFFFADMNAGIPGVDVVYVADDAAGGGIQKYSLVSGSWVSNGTITATSTRGITGVVNGTNVTLYCTSNGTKLSTMTDATGYNVTITGTLTDIATAGTNTAFRGVALVPVAAATPVLSGTPSSLSGFSTSLGMPSGSQSFNVNGSNLTPSGATITITSNAPTNIEVSPTGLAGSWGSTFNFAATGTTVTNVPVYVRLTGTNGGAISGTVSIAGGGATTVNVNVSGTVTQTFYSHTTGSLAAVGSWDTNGDGSGTAPANFTADGQTFVVTNRTTETLDAPWAVSGAASKIVVGNGTTATELIVPSGANTLTGITDVANLGKLTLQNTTLPTFGTLATTSTVEYAQNSSMSILNTTTDLVTYGNLILSNSGFKTFKGNTTTVSGNLTYDGFTNGPLAIEAAAASPFSTVNLAGNLTYLGSVTNPVDADAYTLIANGAGTQTITGNGNTARLFRITTGTTNTVVLSNVGGSTNAVLGNASSGGLTLNAGTTLVLNGNNVTFFPGATTGVVGTGTITGSTLSNMIINKIGTTAFGTLLFTTGSEQLNNLTINTTATTTPTVTLGTKLDLSGTLTLTAGKFILGANNLSATTVSGGSSTAYVVTNGAGALKINNVGSAPITYPVGPSTALYHPATISNTGTIDNYAVKVSSAAPPCANASYSVTATWDIAEDLAGGSNCALTLDYTGAATGGSYDNTLAKIIHCSGATADFKNGSVTGTVASGAGFTNFSPFGVSNDPLVLPVRIVDLKGVSAGKYNHLSWTTEQENANSGFEIQRSEDGNNYEAIGFVQTAAQGGNSATAINYAYDDYKATSIKEYYRLRQVDLNGQSRLTNAILINGKAAIAGIDAVYPNPTINSLNVSVISESHDRVTLTVTDLSGKILSQQSYPAEAGRNILPLNVAKLAPGTYMVQLVGCKNASTIKFVKQ